MSYDSWLMSGPGGPLDDSGDYAARAELSELESAEWDRAQVESGRVLTEWELDLILGCIQALPTSAPPESWTLDEILRREG